MFMTLWLYHDALCVNLHSISVMNNIECFLVKCKSKCRLTFPVAARDFFSFSWLTNVDGMKDL